MVYNMSYFTETFNLILEEINADKIKDYVVYPGLGDNAGVCGALALAKLAKEKDIAFQDIVNVLK